MHQTEALLGILIGCKDERAKGLLADLSKVSLGALNPWPRFIFFAVRHVFGVIPTVNFLLSLRSDGSDIHSRIPLLEK
jgi:hypothetical protein